jgi:zinc transport system substrate-binding protein
MLKPLLPVLFALATTSSANADKINIVTDIAPIHSLVSQVVGNANDITVLVTPNASPHDFALKPSQANALQSANFVFYIDESLTPWIETPLENLAAKARKIALLETKGTIELEMRESVDFDDHEEHHDEHDHGAHDPHAWLSPDNAVLWLDIIAEEISKYDIENASIYRENAKTAKAEILKLKSELQEILALVSERPFLLFHDAFQYFESEFGLNSKGAITLADDDAPSAASMKALQSLFKEQEIVCVLTEPQAKQSLIDAVVPKGTKQAVLDQLGSTLELGPELYKQLLKNIGSQIKKCLTP